MRVRVALALGHNLFIHSNVYYKKKLGIYGRKIASCYSRQALPQMTTHMHRVLRDAPRATIYCAETMNSFLQRVIENNRGRKLCRGGHVPFVLHDDTPYGFVSPIDSEM